MLIRDKFQEAKRLDQEVQAGRLLIERVRTAAWLGDQPSIAMLGMPPRAMPSINKITADLRNWTEWENVVLSYSLACSHVSYYTDRFPTDTGLHDALLFVEEWMRQPGEASRELVRKTLPLVEDRCAKAAKYGGVMKGLHRRLPFWRAEFAAELVNDTVNAVIVDPAEHARLAVEHAVLLHTPAPSRGVSRKLARRRVQGIIRDIFLSLLLDRDDVALLSDIS